VPPRPAATAATAAHNAVNSSSRPTRGTPGTGDAMKRSYGAAAARPSATWRIATPPPTRPIGGPAVPVRRCAVGWRPHGPDARTDATPARHNIDVSSLIEDRDHRTGAPSCPRRVTL